MKSQDYHGQAMRRAKTHPSKNTVTRSLVPARQKTEYGSPRPQLKSGHREGCHEIVSTKDTGGNRGNKRRCAQAS